MDRQIRICLGAALFNQVETLDQGSTHALLTGPAVRHFGDLCPEVAADITKALGLDPSRHTGSTDLQGNEVSNWFATWGIPARLRDVGVSEQHLERAIAHSLQNFNADRKRELAAHRPRLEAILRDVY